MNPDEVRAHWEDWAERYAGDLRATTRTPTAKRLEIDALLRRLRALSFEPSSRARLLEVGCGNGYNAVAIAEAFAAFEVTGIDYVERMVESATRRAQQSPAARRLAFHVGDVLDLAAVAPLDADYDLVLSNRCLINLGSTGCQLRALAALAGRVADGGSLLLVENSQQSFGRQNACREALGLEARNPSEFNHFFDEAEVIPELERHFGSVAVEDFASLHDLVLYVLVPATNGGRIDYDHPLVEAATRLSLARPAACEGAFGSLGQNRLFVCRDPRPGRG